MTAHEIEQKYGAIQVVASFHDLVVRSAEKAGAYRFGPLVIVSFDNGERPLAFFGVHK